MENEVYKAPESELDSGENNDNELASRWARLGASIVDSLVMMVIIFPLIFVLGFWDQMISGEQPGLMFSIMMALIGIIVFLGVNFKFLKDNGQTVGKKVAGIKIVAVDGSKAEMGNHIVKRYLTYFIPGQIPVVGFIFNLVNILCIFKKDKRCIHDLAGGTKVVDL